MCLGLTLTVGSFFTNALPRLLPDRIPMTGIFFVPQLLTLGFMVFWMIRVRLLTGASQSHEPIASTRTDRLIQEGPMVLKIAVRKVRSG